MLIALKRKLKDWWDLIKDLIKTIITTGLLITILGFILNWAIQECQTALKTFQ